MEGGCGLGWGFARGKEVAVAPCERHVTEAIL